MKEKIFKVIKPLRRNSINHLRKDILEIQMILDIQMKKIQKLINL